MRSRSTDRGDSRDLCSSREILQISRKLFGYDKTRPSPMVGEGGAAGGGRGKPIPQNQTGLSYNFILSITVYLRLIFLGRSKPLPYGCRVYLRFRYPFLIFNFQFYSRRRDPACGALRVRQAQDDPSRKGRQMPKQFRFLCSYYSRAALLRGRFTLFLCVAPLQNAVLPLRSPSSLNCFRCPSVH